MKTFAFTVLALLLTACNASNQLYDDVTDDVVSSTTSSLSTAAPDFDVATTAPALVPENALAQVVVVAAAGEDEDGADVRLKCRKWVVWGCGTTTDGRLMTCGYCACGTICTSDWCSDDLCDAGN